MSQEGEGFLSSLSRWQIFSVVSFGLALIMGAMGVKVMIQNRVPADAVEIIVPGDSAKQNSGEVLGETEAAEQIVVDVAGAVKNPGVYQVLSSARVGEVLEKAGGVSQEADLDWVSKNINLAGKLSDGVKVYVPFEGEVVDSDVEGAQSVGGSKSSIHSMVNVNTADLGTLDSLWGIGEVRASSIIENRPYGSIWELEEKAGVPRNVIEKNQEELSL